MMVATVVYSQWVEPYQTLLLDIFPENIFEMVDGKYLVRGDAVPLIKNMVVTVRTHISEMNDEITSMVNERMKAIAL
jgi:hypothetical protein